METPVATPTESAPARSGRSTVLTVLWELPARSARALGHRRSPLPALAALVALALVAPALVAASCSGDGASSDDADDASDAPASTTAGTPGGGSGGDGESLDRVPERRYLTRPDLTPPAVEVVTATSSSPGLVCLAPKRGGAQAGPLIVDGRGEAVWAAPLPAGEVAADLRVQTYGGRPVLTWWEGRSAEGRGTGELVIVDETYDEVARLQTGGGLDADFHEFRLTDEGTALLIAYTPEPADLSGVGGPAQGHEFESVIQEVDVATGDVVFEWRAGDHVPVTDTYSEITDDEPGTEEAPLDWFHANSVAPGPDGTLLVSARNTHAVYAVDRATGEVRWRMGGKSSDIAMGAGTAFEWQHDAQWHGGTRISLFDNHASTTGGEASRALVLDVDTRAKTAELVTELRHPEGVSAGTQGNTQLLDGGATFVGWGSEGQATEYSAAGEIVFDATFAPADSYRAYRCAWSGRPTEPPDVTVRPVDEAPAASTGAAAAGDGSGDGDEAGGVEVAVSWNGATEVATWRILAGDGDDLTTVAEVRRHGFETVATIGRADVVAVEALDAKGAVLERSPAVTVER